jgi:hypothetical protein
MDIHQNQRRKITLDKDKIKKDLIVETESMRVWATPKEEKDKILDKDDIKINFNNEEYNLCGFNMIHSKKDNKLVFAYKIKKKDDGNRFILYYLPDKLSDENKNVANDVFYMISGMAKMFNYNIENVIDVFKRMTEDKEVWRRINENDEKTKKS